MSAARKTIATTITAVALAAPAFAAFAGESSQGYGRAGGTANGNTAQSVSATDGERVYGTIIQNVEFYGRAGRPTGSAAVMQSAAWGSDAAEPASMPSVPGRQGAPQTIDNLRG